MRFGTLGPAALILASTTFGCAQVAGIQDISASVPDQHCVDTANVLRASAGLPALTRWLDQEQCADETAAIVASGGTFPSCLGGAAEFDTGFGVVDPDTLLQQTVNGDLADGGAGYLRDATYTKLACGYGTASQFSGAALIYGN